MRLGSLVAILVCGWVFAGGCADKKAGTDAGTVSSTGGVPATGGVSTGGVVATGGTATGGVIATGGVATGGQTATGGVATGGESATGGTATGGVVGTGGQARTGGTVSPDAGSGRDSAPGGATAGTTVGTGGAGAGGGTMTIAGCDDTSTTQLSFTKQYQDDIITVANSTKTYHTMTNWWHKFASQTVTLDGLSMLIKNPGVSVPATDGNPMGFPTIFIGNYQGKKTEGSNLPKQVSALTSVPTIFSSNSLSLDTSNFNATYDVWFTATNADLPARQSSPGKGGAYLMVWMFDPSDRQPRGGAPKGDGGLGPNVAAHTVTGVDGTWDVWIDKTDPLCISYVRTTPSDGMAFDLNTFIKDSVTNNYGITDSMYLAIVFAGFEVWGGGDGLQLKRFCAAVN